MRENEYLESIDLSDRELVELEDAKRRRAEEDHFTKLQSQQIACFKEKALRLLDLARKTNALDRKNATPTDFRSWKPRMQAEFLMGRRSLERLLDGHRDGVLWEHCGAFLQRLIDGDEGGG